MTNKLISMILIICSFCLITGCNNDSTGSLPYYNTPDFTPQWLSNNDAENVHKISSFSFTDQDGKQFTDEDLQGKIYIADFFFTSCPGICPAITKNLLKVQKEFSDENIIEIVSFSVMPQSDSVPALKNYESNFALQSGMWHLLTGNVSEIYTLARQSYFAEKNAGFNSDSTEFLHTENVLLVDKQGRIRGIYNGTIALDMDRIITDIKILIKEG